MFWWHIWRPSLTWTDRRLFMVVVVVNRNSLHFSILCLSMRCCSRSCWNGCYMIYIPYSLSKMKNKKKHNSECFWPQRFQQRVRRLAPNRARNGHRHRNRKLLYFAFVRISRFRDLEFSLASSMRPHTRMFLFWWAAAWNVWIVMWPRRGLEGSKSRKQKKQSV